MSLLMIGTTRLEPRWKDILGKKQFQSSHYSNLLINNFVKVILNIITRISILVGISECFTFLVR